MNGAQGGMVTADNRNLDQLRDPLKAVWNEERSWEECLRIGQLMASEASRLLTKAKAQTNPQVVCQVRRVPFRSTPTSLASLQSLAVGLQSKRSGA